MIEFIQKVDKKCFDFFLHIVYINIIFMYVILKKIHIMCFFLQKTLKIMSQDINDDNIL